MIRENEYGANFVSIEKSGNKLLPDQFWPCLYFQYPEALPQVLISYLVDQSSGLSNLVI